MAMVPLPGARSAQCSGNERHGATRRSFPEHWGRMARRRRTAQREPCLSSSKGHHDPFRRYHGDCIEYFQGRHQFTGCVYLDLQAAVIAINQLGEALGPDADAREVFRPGGDHLPVEGLGTRTLLRRGGAFRVFLQPASASCCKAYARCGGGGRDVSCNAPSVVLVLPMDRRW